ncbi:MAG: F0F1 ATP synthase subunit A [Planctomycetota bacterium]
MSGGLEQISTDQLVYWRWKFVTINQTLIATWGVMAVLVLGSWLVTRRLTSGSKPTRLQSLLEVVIENIREQIRAMAEGSAGAYLPFIGTLFLFIAVANLLAIVPGYEAPTSSLSTTAALAICVFIAVPLFGIASQGVGRYLAEYLKPSIFMLPFNIIGEISRTLTLAIRLFGNIMSEAKVVAILLAIAPLFFPIVMQALGLLTGLVQAYIFAVLSMVYIASATQVRKRRETGPPVATPAAPKGGN